MYCTHSCVLQTTFRDAFFVCEWMCVYDSVSSDLFSILWCTDVLPLSLLLYLIVLLFGYSFTSTFTRVPIFSGRKHRTSLFIPTKYCIRSDFFPSHSLAWDILALFRHIHYKNKKFEFIFLINLSPTSFVSAWYFFFFFIAKSTFLNSYQN